MSTGPTRDEVLAALGDRGHAVTTSQLARWHRAGLLPQPRQEALGRGLGTVTIYPPGTIAQALALCVILGQDRKLRNAGFTLWWDGFPVRPSLVRAPIDRAAQQLEAQQQQLISGVEYGSPTTPVAGALARRLGPDRTREMLDSTRALLVAQTEPKTLPELSLGDHVPTRAELPQLMAEALGSVLGGSPATHVVAEASDVDLARARDRIKHLVEAVGRWAEPMAWLMGGSGTVFKIMQLVTELIRPADYPDMVLGMLLMERILPADFAVLLDTPLPDPPGMDGIRLAQRIQTKIPAAKGVVTPAAMRALGRGKEAAGRHLERIGDFAESHRPEIDAVVDQRAPGVVPGLSEASS